MTPWNIERICFKQIDANKDGEKVDRTYGYKYGKTRGDLSQVVHLDQSVDLEGLPVSHHLWAPFQDEVVVRDEEGNPRPGGLDKKVLLGSWICNGFYLDLTNNAHVQFETLF